MIRRILLLALALTAACDPTDAVTPIPGDVAMQRQVWQAQGIDDYRFTLGRACHCSPLPEVRVEVRDGQVVEVREVESGRRLWDGDWEQVPSVDELFEELAGAQARGEYTAAAYHPTLGYPMGATIGEMALDAGVAYRLRDLRALN